MMKYMIVVLLVIAGSVFGNKRESDSEECRCVPQHHCTRDSAEEDNLPLINIQGASLCNHYLEKCCTDIKRASLQRKPVRKGCGYRNHDGIDFKIEVENSESQFAEFPWVVTILDIADENDYKCAGSLIHPNVILTAANCVSGKNASTLRIRAGEWDMQTINEPLPYQEQNASKIIIHEKYSPALADDVKNDFALIIVLHQFVLTDNVNTVCLPDSDSINDFDDDLCFVAGWGNNTFGKENEYQNIMKKVHASILSHDKCENFARNGSLGEKFHLHASFMCAGGEGWDYSHKLIERGAPLVCALKWNKERYEQAGIVAWSIVNSHDGKLDFYANVAHARKWIDNRMTSMRFDTSYYIDHREPETMWDKMKDIFRKIIPN